MKKLFLLLLLPCLFANSQKFNTENNLTRILNDSNQKNEFAKFIDNILYQFDSKDLFKSLDKTEDKDNLSIYELFFSLCKKIEKRPNFVYQLKSLKKQKEVLSAQAFSLLRDKELIDGYIEIGAPAIYTNQLKKYRKLNGKSYAIYEQQQIADLFKANSLNPLNKFFAYDQFIKLDYSKINSWQIPDNSVDLITCFIGMHHIPEEYLNDFAKFIYRVLKVDGVFLLRDHDCINQNLYDLTFAAHSIFNATISKETIENEKNEIRNFQPLSFWIQLLEENGFKASNERLLQNGDPTLNTMVKFTKVVDKKTQDLNNIKKALNKDVNYKRELIQSYLSSPEWFNVDISQEYGEFINHTPFYQFPYINCIKKYWQVFKNSWQVAAKNSSNLEVLKSPSTLMNLFVGITMTIEYGAKSLISFPVRLMYQGDEPEFVQAIVIDNKNEILNLNKNIKIIKDEDNYKIAQLPRYKQFLDTLIKASKTDIQFIEISGNEQIQIKIKYNKAKNIHFDIEGCKKEYQWQLPTQPDFVYANLTVKLKNIKEVINYLINNEVEIKYIHDF